MDMIYSHIAKDPLSPSAIESSIPENLSKIILKPLAKIQNRDTRVLTGILYDLEWISSTQHHKDNFILGKKTSSEFSYP